MEKYGWSKGKGLGANEDGRVENVGIKMKSDNKGVGCSKKFADKWIEHQDDFNDLLQSLNQDQNNSDDSQDHKVVSLEKKSETSRKRVHYMKFTKGKDLSSRSKEDLECIFGTKKHKKKTKVEEEIVEEEVVKEEVKVTTNDIHDTDHGVKTFTNTCSIQEYFALKMKQRKEAMMGLSDNNSQSGALNGFGAEVSDSSNQSDPSNDVDADQSETVLENKSLNVSLESKKRKRVSFNLDYDLFEFDKDSCSISENVAENVAENGEDENGPRKSKKKKKLNFEAGDEDDSQEDNSGENFVKITKKKKKSKVTEIENCEETTEIHKKSKKLKKSKKSKQEEDESETGIFESPKKKKTKSKMEEEGSSEFLNGLSKRRKSSKVPEYHNVCFSDDASDTSDSVVGLQKNVVKKSSIHKNEIDIDFESKSEEELTPKKKKKAKKCKTNTKSRKLSENFEDDSTLDTEVESCKETKKKKKSNRYKNDSIVNDDDDDDEANLTEISSEKRSKKKKKRSKSGGEIMSDIAFNPSNTDLSPKNKKSKKSKNRENDISEVSATNGHVEISDLEEPKRQRQVRIEYHEIDRTNSKKGYSLTSPEVESVCKNFKGSNFHQIVGYLNSGLVATEHYS